MSILTEALLAALLAACLACGWFYWDSRDLGEKLDQAETAVELQRAAAKGQEAARRAVEDQARLTEKAYADRDHEYRRIAEQLRTLRADKTAARRADPEYGAWAVGPLPRALLERLRPSMPGPGAPGGGPDPAAGIPHPADSAPGPPGH